MTCPNCGAVVKPGKKFCGGCGVQVSEPGPPEAGAGGNRESACPNCGAAVSASKRFCGSCGAIVAKDAGPAALADPAGKAGDRGQAQSAPTPHSGAAGAPFSAAYGSEPPSRGLAFEARARRPLPTKSIAGIAAALVLLFASAIWFSRGVQLDIISDPPGSEVAIDGQAAGVTDAQFGGLSIPRLGRGAHQVQVVHYGFEVWSEPVSLGWFRLSKKLTVKLALPTFPLTLLTNPGGATVQLDAKAAGTSDSLGNLTLPNVPTGRHTLSVSLKGYPAWSQAVFIQSAENLRVDLAAAAAAQAQEIASRLQHVTELIQQQQLEAAMGECQAVLDLEPSNPQASDLKNTIQQAMAAQSEAAAKQQIESSLARAQALYQQQQFQAAIAQCDAVLAADPTNQKAAKLKSQIQQTASILGGR